MSSRLLLLPAALLTCLTTALPVRAGHSHACRETSDVVGERRCGRFGDFWSTERSIPLFIGLSGFTGAVQPGGAPLRPSESQGVDPVRVVDGPGLGHAATSPSADSGAAARSGINFVQGRAGLLGGLRMPLGPVSIRLESLVGLQPLWFGYRSSTQKGITDGSVGGIGFLLEPRVALDWWVTPDTTLAVFMGTNVIRPGDYVGGLSISAHLRAFDGAYE